MNGELSVEIVCEHCDGKLFSIHMENEILYLCPLCCVEFSRAELQRQAAHAGAQIVEPPKLTIL
jgi:DNA-binding helix-hairpin-helix protein with protein kinase domain